MFTFRKPIISIASDVINYFTKKNIAILPVHDSFIVEKTYENELLNVMEKAYKKRFKYNPEINFK